MDAVRGDHEKERDACRCRLLRGAAIDQRTKHNQSADKCADKSRDFPQIHDIPLKGLLWRDR